jgi:hypothetical protein
LVNVGADTDQCTDKTGAPLGCRGATSHHAGLGSAGGLASGRRPGGHYRRTGRVAVGSRRSECFDPADRGRSAVTERATPPAASGRLRSTGGSSPRAIPVRSRA